MKIRFNTTGLTALGVTVAGFAVAGGVALTELNNEDCKPLSEVVIEINGGPVQFGDLSVFSKIKNLKIAQDNQDGTCIISGQ